MSNLTKMFIELFPCLIIGYIIGNNFPKLSKSISKPYLITQRNIIKDNSLLKNLLKIFSSPAIKGIFFLFYDYVDTIKQNNFLIYFLPSKVIILLSLSLVGII